MSFTAEVKTQICNADWKECCRKAQLASLIQMCSTMNITSQGMHIRIQCEHANTAKHVWKLLKENYHVEPQLSVLRKIKLKKNNIYVIRVNTKALEILKDLGIYTEQGLQTHISARLLRRDCCAQSYLAGAFLAGGSVNAPQTTNYHLEISSSEESMAKFLCRLMNRFDLPAKVIKRRAQFVVYLKVSQAAGGYRMDRKLSSFRDIVRQAPACHRGPQSTSGSQHE